MHPHTHLSASIVIAMMLWFPSLMATLDGDLDLFSAAIRFAIALTGVRLALGLLGYLYDSYKAVGAEDVQATGNEMQPAP